MQGEEKRDIHPLRRVVICGNWCLSSISGLVVILGAVSSAV